MESPNRQLAPSLIRISKRYQYLILIASIISLICVLAIFLSSNNVTLPTNEEEPIINKIDPNTIYAANYSTMPNLSQSNTRKKSIDVNEGKSSKVRAFNAYDVSQWQQAKEQFNKEVNETSDQEALFYLAMVELELNNYKNAKSHLESYLNQHYKDEQYNYEKDAQWYLALIHLKLNDFTKSQYYLNELAIDASPFQSKAINLLNQISN